MKRKFIQVIVPLMIAVLLVLTGLAFMAPVAAEVPNGIAAMSDGFMGVVLAPGPLIDAETFAINAGLLNANIAWMYFAAAVVLALTYLPLRDLVGGTGESTQHFTEAPRNFPLKFPVVTVRV